MPFDTHSAARVERAYMRVHIKAPQDNHKRVITGMATTPTADRVGDIVDPMGARIGKGVKLLWQHNHDKPVGEVRFGKPTEKGIPFTATLKKPQDDYPQSLRDRLEEAWVSVRDGLVEFVSIGFRTIAYEILDTGGIRFTEWEMLELSLVTIPANAEATINTIKSIDRELRAASGDQYRVQWLSSARARASTKRTERKGVLPMSKKTLAEQIAAWEAELEGVESKLKAIQQHALDEGRTKDDDEQEQFDELCERAKAVKKELEDLRALESFRAEKAAPVTAAQKSEDVADDRAGKKRRSSAAVLGPNKNIPEGIPFARMVMCLGAAKGNEFAAAEIARKMYPDDARISKYLEIKAAVPAAYTGDSGGWAEDIAEAQTIATEFIEFLRPQNVVDRLAPRMTRVPFNVKVTRLSTGQTGYWVGEALPAPMTSGVFDTVTLGKTKVASISALSKEQMRFSNISAETAIRNDLAGAVAARMDTTFVSTAAAVSGVSPAGILNGLSAISSAGDTADNVRTDLVNLFEPFSTADIPWSNLAYVTTENIRYALMVMKSSLGVREFPDVREGTLDGQPLIASNHVSGGDLIAISTPDILLADDGEISVEFSDQASLEMLDASLLQDGTAGTGASLVSLWQSGLVGIKIERHVNWVKGRSAAVAYIGDATYQGAATT